MLHHLVSLWSIRYDSIQYPVAPCLAYMFETALHTCATGPTIPLEVAAFVHLSACLVHSQLNSLSMVKVVRVQLACSRKPLDVLVTYFRTTLAHTLNFLSSPILLLAPFRSWMRILRPRMRRFLPSMLLLVLAALFRGTVAGRLTRAVWIDSEGGLSVPFASPGTGWLLLCQLFRMYATPLDGLRRKMRSSQPYAGCLKRGLNSIVRTSCSAPKSSLQHGQNMSCR